MNKELRISYEILKKVYIDKSYVSIELNKYINNSSSVNTATITKIVYGVVVSQPVVLNFKGVARVLILVNVEGHYKKFCYSIYEQDTANMSESSMVKTIFANIALSTVGDRVYFGITQPEDGVSEGKICRFINYTRRLNSR